MKRTIIMLVLETTTFICKAQKGLGYEKGDKLLNIGVGVNSYYGSGFPIGASFEIGIRDAIK